MRSKRILAAVASKHKLQVSDILGRDRFDHFVEARREAIVQMRAAGMTPGTIARVMSRDRTTIYHHINDRMRANKREYHSRRWRERHVERAST